MPVVQLHIHLQLYDRRRSRQCARAAVTGLRLAVEMPNFWTLYPKIKALSPEATFAGVEALSYFQERDLSHAFRALACAPRVCSPEP